MQDEGSEDMTLLISANEVAQIAFKVPSVIAASLKFAGVGFIAMFVVVNIDAMVDCVDVMAWHLSFSWAILNGETVLKGFFF